jgi:hypothetical protein
LTREVGVSALAVPTLTLITSRKARASGSHKLTGLKAELINEIMNDEAQHVPIIQNLLNDPDNPLPVPIRQPPNFNMKRLKQPNLQTFLETASVFENTGSGLYHGALLNVTQTQEYFPTASRPAGSSVDSAASKGEAASGSSNCAAPSFPSAGNSQRGSNRPERGSEFIFGTPHGWSDPGVEFDAPRMEGRWPSLAI